jgi:hypothetical protein
MVPFYRLSMLDGISDMFNAIFALQFLDFFPVELLR